MAYMQCVLCTSARRADVAVGLDHLLRGDRLTSSIWEIFPCFRYSSRLCIRPGVCRQLSEAENCDERAAILYTVTEVCICVWVFCEQERKQRAHALTFCTSHLHTEMEARSYFFAFKVGTKSHICWPPCRISWAGQSQGGIVLADVG